MAKTKKAQEVPATEPQQQERTPLGFTARDDKNATVTMTQFFDLMKVVSTLSNLVNFVKQENFNNNNIKYYFQEDLVEAKDKDGNTIMTKDQEGKDVPQMVLRSDFWN